jgi:amino-acid N-acetyltransferase
MSETSFVFASETDLGSVVQLLRECGLAHEDIHHHLSGLIVAEQDSLLVGTVALEAYDSAGLLRSLAVRESWRSRGIARELLRRAIAYAQSKRLAQCFLLTSTATDYFVKHGFEVVSRDSVPKEIAATEEFRSLCPSSAICMRKRLVAVAKQE